MISEEELKSYTYTQAVTDSKLGKIEVSASGPLGAAVAIASTDFKSPASVTGSLAAIAAFIPGYGVAISGALSVIGGLFGKASAAAVYQQQIMTGLQQVSQQISGISSQLASGLSGLASGIENQTVELKSFMQQMNAEKQQAFKMALAEVSQITSAGTTEIAKIQEASIEQIQSTRMAALSQAENIVVTAIADVENEYQQSKLQALQLFQPAIESMSKALWEKFKNVPTFDAPSVDLDGLGDLIDTVSVDDLVDQLPPSPIDLDGLGDLFFSWSPPIENRILSAVELTTEQLSQFPDFKTLYEYVYVDEFFAQLYDTYKALFSSEFGSSYSPLSESQARAVVTAYGLYGLLTKTPDAYYTALSSVGGNQMSDDIWAWIKTETGVTNYSGALLLYALRLMSQDAGTNTIAKRWQDAGGKLDSFAWKPYSFVVDLATQWQKYTEGGSQTITTPAKGTDFDKLLPILGTLLLLA